MALTSISITPTNTVTAINCGSNGSSSPKLSGTIDLTAFTNLNSFICNNNDITGITGYTSNTNIVTFNVSNNKITGSIPSLNAMTSLLFFFAMYNNFSGNLPSFSSSVLRQFKVGNGDFYTGPKISGSVPSLNSLPNLEWFEASNHHLSGAFPSVSNNTNLVLLQIARNKDSSDPTYPGFSGNIPSFTNNPNLAVVHLFDNSFTGFAGGTVSSKIEQFYAFNNNLTTTAVNDILAAFVAAGRTSASGVCNLFLDGTGNAGPSGQGIIDKNTLISRGWVVNTN